MNVCTHSWHQSSAKVINAEVPKLAPTCIHNSIVSTASFLPIYLSIWPKSLSGSIKIPCEDNLSFLWSQFFGDSHTAIQNIMSEYTVNIKANILFWSN